MGDMLVNCRHMALEVVALCEVCLANAARERLDAQMGVPDVLVEVASLPKPLLAVRALEFPRALLHDELVPSESVAPPKLRAALITRVGRRG
jgi:hypothetical protein